MSWNSTLFSCALVTALAGCESQPPALAPVRGQVIYQGRPLPSGMIVFTPDAQRGSNGPSAKGDIQADGSYTLTTDGQLGAVAGWHRVTLAALEVQPTGMRGTLAQRAQPLLPTRYSDPELSGQVQEVKPGKENILDFRLD